MEDGMSIGKPGLERLRWGLQRAWQEAGLPELCALAVLALWLGLQFTVLPPLHEEQARQSQALQQLAQRMRAAPVASAMAPVSVSSGLLAFLPVTAEREDQLKKMHAMAATRGVRLGRVDYREEAGNTRAMQHLGVRMALSGDYVALRRYVHDVLAAFPNLAVDSISLEKSADGPGAMNLALAASLYYRVAGRAP
jgi:Tfp pilus assembly protein PilO